MECVHSRHWCSANFDHISAYRIIATDMAVHFILLDKFSKLLETYALIEGETHSLEVGPVTRDRIGNEA